MKSLFLLLQVLTLTQLSAAHCNSGYASGHPPCHQCENDQGEGDNPNGYATMYRGSEVYGQYDFCGIYSSTDNATCCSPNLSLNSVYSDTSKIKTQWGWGALNVFRNGDSVQIRVMDARNSQTAALQKQVNDTTVFQVPNLVAINLGFEIPKDQLDTFVKINFTGTSLLPGDLHINLPSDKKNAFGFKYNDEQWTTADQPRCNSAFDVTQSKGSDAINNNCGFTIAATAVPPAPVSPPVSSHSASSTPAPRIK